MNAKEYIDSSIPYLREKDTIDFGLSIFEDFNLEFLPVVSSEKVFLGLVSETHLLNSLVQKDVSKVVLTNKEAFVKSFR